MSTTIETISPIDGSVCARTPLADAPSIERVLNRARQAQPAWRETPLAQRCALLERFCAAFEAKMAAIADELTLQIGRPIRYTPNEVRGMLERARHMIAIAPQALADIEPGEKADFRRFIRREPLGVVLSVAAWNYPYLIAVNSVIPALLAGNAVILKHSAQTPLCAERYAQCFTDAGLPDGVFQVLHLAHADTEKLIRDPRIDFVAFTGSVAGGHAVQRAAAERFMGVGLELGGCDPVYVRYDANLAHAIENVVDGAFFNSGQSCCGLQRIYVHERIYDDFISGAITLTQQYLLGDPRQQATTLGPVVRTAAAQGIRAQVQASIALGARAAIDARDFPADQPGTPYLAPQLLLNADHNMPVMREEIFGPVAGVMKVSSDQQAVAMMNDSAFGLTAAVWSEDVEAALSIGNQVQTGTFFLNRCDYLDPALAWVGVKDSGRGCTLSVVGFEHLTRPKSFHLRVKT